MFKFDEEKALKLIMEETKDDCPILPMARVEQLRKIHPALYPIVEKWLNGEKCEYEFKGINLKYICDKLHETFIGAVLIMSGFLEEPERVDRFKSVKFNIR